MKLLYQNSMFMENKQFFLTLHFNWIDDNQVNCRVSLISLIPSIVMKVAFTRLYGQYIIGVLTMLCKLL